MSTHTICGFVGDLAHFGAKTTYLRIKPRSGRIGASVRARERARNRAKDTNERRDGISALISVWPDRDWPDLGRDPLISGRDGLISAEIHWSRAEMHNSGQVGKFLLWNLGPDLGRDFWPRFFDRDFLDRDFSWPRFPWLGRDGPISAEISRSRPRFFDLGRDFRYPDALKVLLPNLGHDWPDLGRDFCPRFSVRRFNFIFGSVLA